MIGTREDRVVRKIGWLLVGLVGVAGVALFIVPRPSGTTEPLLAGTLLHGRAAPDFRLTDQFHRSISLRQFRGHPVVLTFLEAHCRETCPLVADKIRQAVTRLAPEGRRIGVLVVSADPEGDTILAVRRFSRAHGMLHRWHYLIGNRRQLAPVWHAYYIYAAPKNAPAAIKDAHTSAIYLIDRSGQERVLLTGDPDERMLIRDLQLLSGILVTSPAEAVPAPEVGHPAPNFTLASLHGPSIALHAFRGKVVLVNFWATWCIPCRTEMPMVAGWYRKLHRRRFVIIGVDQQEGRADVQDFTHRLGIPYPIALDSSGSVSARYNVVGLPTSFLLGPDGTIRSSHIGILSPAYLRQQILPMLREQAHG